MALTRFPSGRWSPLEDLQAIGALSVGLGGGLARTAYMCLLGYYLLRLTAGFRSPMRLCCRAVLPGLYGLALAICLLRTYRTPTLGRAYDYAQIMVSGCAPLLLVLLCGGGHTDSISKRLFPIPTTDGFAPPGYTHKDWRAKYTKNMGLVIACTLALTEHRLFTVHECISHPLMCYAPAGSRAGFCSLIAISAGPPTIPRDEEVVDVNGTRW